MIARLPRWVLAYAAVLAFMAGIINVVGFLSFEHQAVTHLTGTTTLLSAALAGGQGGMALHLLAVLGAFFAGAALSGLIIGDSTLRLGRRYGVALLLESAVLLLAVRYLQDGANLGIYLAGLACGLQNAMATTFSGTVIRTSHVTGMFTDLGIYFGHLLRRAPVERRRVIISLTVIGGFVAGGISGALGFQPWGFGVLYVPAGLAAGLALVYAGYRWRAAGPGG